MCRLYSCVLAIAGRSANNDAVLRFVARRVALTIPVLLGVATLVFLLIHLIPGDPAQAMLGEAAPQADVEALRTQLKLDRPLLEQYVDFLGGVMRGDLGTSLRTRTSVTGQIAARLPATFELALAAMLVAMFVAMPLGIAAAAWRERPSAGSSCSPSSPPSRSSSCPRRSR